jgi:hypothetical protein
MQNAMVLVRRRIERNLVIYTHCLPRDVVIIRRTCTCTTVGIAVYLLFIIPTLSLESSSLSRATHELTNC